MISRELFTESINSIIDADNYQKSLNKFFKDNDVDGYIYQPDCSIAVVNLLHGIFEDADNSDVISYFCFDLEFGKKWKSGMFKEEGKEIKLATIDDLYDYLITRS